MKRLLIAVICLFTMSLTACTMPLDISNCVVLDKQCFLHHPVSEVTYVSRWDSENGQLVKEPQYSTTGFEDIYELWIQFNYTDGTHRQVWIKVDPNTYDLYEIRDDYILTGNELYVDGAPYNETLSDSYDVGR